MNGHFWKSPESMITILVHVTEVDSDPETKLKAARMTRSRQINHNRIANKPVVVDKQR